MDFFLQKFICLSVKSRFLCQAPSTTQLTLLERQRASPNLAEAALKLSIKIFKAKLNIGMIGGLALQ